MHFLLHRRKCAREVDYEKKEAWELLSNFLEEERIPRLVSYIHYNAGETQGAPPHRDVDTVFATSIVYLQDTTVGRLQVNGHNLPEFFNAGDFLLIDPRKVHSVACAIRDTHRKVLVFTL